jgi:hypothetical protein
VQDAAPLGELLVAGNHSGQMHRGAPDAPIGLKGAVGGRESENNKTVLIPGFRLLFYVLQCNELLVARFSPFSQVFLQ